MYSMNTVRSKSIDGPPVRIAMNWTAHVKQIIDNVTTAATMNSIM